MVARPGVPDITDSLSSGAGPPRGVPGRSSARKSTQESTLLSFTVLTKVCGGLRDVDSSRRPISSSKAEITSQIGEMKSIHLATKGCHNGAVKAQGTKASPPSLMPGQPGMQGTPE